MLELLLVENDPASARMICDLVEGTGQCTVKAIDGASRSVAEECAENHYDAVLVDLYMEYGEPDGIALAKAIRKKSPKTRIIVCTSSEVPKNASRAWDTGIDGYLPKKHLVDDPSLVPTICGLLTKGYSVFGLDPRESTLGLLSERELEVLRLKADGKTHREISEALFVSTRTVDSHLSHAKSKLSVENADDLIPTARSYGLI